MNMKGFKIIRKKDSPDYYKTQIEKVKKELDDLIERSDELVLPQIISISQKLDKLILKYIRTSHGE